MNLEEFLKYLTDDKGLSGRSARAYEGDVRHFADFAKASTPRDFAGITQSDIYRYISSLREENMSQSTVTRRLASVRALFAWLVREGVCRENPAEGIRLTAPEKRPPEYLTLEEVEKLLDATDDSSLGIRDRAMLEILYGTGIGVGELVDVNVEDINLKMGILTCGSGSRERIVPLGRHARKALEDYIYRVRSPRLSEDSLEDALFINRDGGRISRQGVWKLLRKYGQKAGLEKEITPNILRNSFAIHMISNGADMKTLRDLMGQETIAAVQSYLESSRPRIKDVYDKTHPRA